MPIYEYRCRDCGEHFERRQTLSDEQLKTCEKCGGGLEKQWSLSGFQFKGAGWYVTDYSKKNSGSDGKAASDKSEKGSSSESTEKSAPASNKGETSKKSDPPSK